MRAQVSELRLVVDVVRGRRLAVEAAIVEEPHPLGARHQHRSHHVPRVLEAVHVADLVAVIGGDGQLLDAEAGEEELDDDLGVEVEVVGVEGEGDLLEGGH